MLPSFIAQKYHSQGLKYSPFYRDQCQCGLGNSVIYKLAMCTFRERSHHHEVTRVATGLPGKWLHTTLFRQRLCSGHFSKVIWNQFNRCSPICGLLCVVCMGHQYLFVHCLSIVRTHTTSVSCHILIKTAITKVLNGDLTFG